MSQDPIQLGRCGRMTAKHWATIQAHPDLWVQEPKLDGFRMQLVRDVDGHELYSRNFKMNTGKFPAIEGWVWKIPPRTILDGEVVAFDANGKANFNLTARIMGSDADEAVRKSLDVDLRYIVFDIPLFDMDDLRSQSYAARREVLVQLIGRIPSNVMRVIPQYPASQYWHEQLTEAYGEGTVLKKLTCRYGDGWLKWKKTDTEDVVITGFTNGRGKYADTIGAIGFGQYKDGKLVYRGKCSGMPDALRYAISRDRDAYKGRVMEIAHGGLFKARFRFPQFKRLRDDKPASECTWTEEE